MRLENKPLGTGQLEIVPVLHGAIVLVIVLCGVSPDILLPHLESECVDVVIGQPPATLIGARGIKYHLRPPGDRGRVLLHQEPPVAPLLEGRVREIH